MLSEVNLYECFKILKNREWKVEKLILFALSPKIACARERIEKAARRVKVMERMEGGSTLRSSMRYFNLLTVV